MGTGNIRPFQSITGEPRFASDLGADPRDLFSIAGEAPAFDQDNLAIGFPSLWQIESECELVSRELRFALSRAIEQLPDRLNDFPGGRALDLLKELVAAFQFGGDVRAPRLWSQASRSARWSREWTSAASLCKR